MGPFILRRLFIISGGQTGADRAALDFALSQGMEAAGWCPKGRRAEDGPIPDKYLLRETPSTNYNQRTEWNVRDADGTVIFSLVPILSTGSLRTLEQARRLNKPVLHISKERSETGRELVKFIESNNIRVLNVAGPRGSKEPLVYDFVMQSLQALTKAEIGR